MIRLAVLQKFSWNRNLYVAANFISGEIGLRGDLLSWLTRAGFLVGSLE